MKRLDDGNRGAVEQERLTAFLLSRGEPPSPAALRAANLGPYAYAALGGDHPDRPFYGSEFLASLGRHEEIKREVGPLFAAWNEAGIEVLLFKGFPLAEYVYPVPGARFHGDVDVVLRPRDLIHAGRVAARLGWSGRPSPMEAPLPHSHLAYNLYRPGGNAWLDVQRYVVHCAGLRSVRQRRLTEAVWERAIECEFEDTRVRQPHPVDAALVCLLVHRAWGSEGWGLKPHDLLDLRFLSERAGVTRAALEARAASWDAAARSQRCWNGVIRGWDGSAMGRPRALQAWALDLRTASEHAPLRAERALVRAARTPGLITGRAAGAARSARRPPGPSPRAGPAPAARLGNADGDRPAPRCLTTRESMGLVRGIRWGERLLPRGDPGGCVVRSLALYRALRLRGLPVTFVSGVRREAGTRSSVTRGSNWMARCCPNSPKPAISSDTASTFATRLPVAEARGRPGPAAVRSPSVSGRYRGRESGPRPRPPRCRVPPG